MVPLPILDSHMHLDPRGDPVGSVKRFLRSGGTHLVIAHKPYSKGPVLDLKGYKEEFLTTVRMKELAERSGVKAWCVVGPYPGEMPGQCLALGMEGALELQISAVEAALGLIDEGRVLGIGEVGRVHFQVDREVQALCDEVLIRAMEGASERGAPVIMHTESLEANPELLDHISDMCDRSGFKRTMAVKHYSGPDTVLKAFELGLSASMLSRRENLRAALGQGLYPLLETDYMDDPDRPDVVMPPDTVPKKVAWAREVLGIDDEVHHKLMVETPLRSLGIDLGQV